MNCRRLIILCALAISPSFAQVSSESLWQDDAEHTARRQFGPIREKTDHGDGTSTSSNWSGYAVLGSAFEWAKGSWVVPVANCSGVGRFQQQYAAFWVGLDGYNSNTVEQTGTDSDCEGTTPTYYAWYEFYPRASVEIGSLSIKPGDVMSAIVYYNSATDRFAVSITDESTGQSFATTGAVAGATRSSAEWITEAPCCTLTDGILPLSDFGTVNFGKDTGGVAATNWARDNSTEGPIGSFPAVNTIQIDKTGSNTSPQTSTCSALSKDGTSFSCSWGQ
jgi:hypothetical protein